MNLTRAPFGVCAILALAGTTYSTTWEPSEDGEKLFALRVKAILDVKCLSCHGSPGKKRKAGLSLASRDEALKGGNSGAALTPGDPSRSPLYRAVLWTDPDLRMPPKENDRLSTEDVRAVRNWILAGAPWPSTSRIAALRAAAEKESSSGVRMKTSGGLSPEWTRRTYEPDKVWAYRPLRKPTPPSPGASHPVDAFLLASMKGLGIPPAPRADRRTIIRRVTFGLTGLPPTPKEVEAFLRDPADDAEAMNRLVHGLLNRTQYGEQWGRHWLDVVRYADSSGYSNDYPRPHAWRYRDYVVRSFNADKPYDRFVLEQLAGDELDPRDPEMLVAVGFLRMGPWEQTMMSVPRVTRQQFLDDVTDTVGQVFLSHPLQCARCHDHKFDPVPTRDYYSIQAVFATTQFAERDAPFLPSENRRGFQEDLLLLRKRVARLERIRKEIGPRTPKIDTRSSALRRIATKNLNRIRWEEFRTRPIAFSVYSGKTVLKPDVFWRLEMPRDPMRTGILEETAILTGGSLDAPGETIAPGVLSAVGLDATIPKTASGRRLAFARWVSDPKNPLVSRSIVNRVWQVHFGRGLAGNPNNFGATGRTPTHPELLDWLASWFVENGWSIKKLHRLILSSDAYARASRHPDPKLLSRKDPGRASYAVFRLRRLDAEEIRDAMLAVSGELNLEVGGIPVRPDINREAAFQPRQIMGTFAPAYQPSAKPADRNRRTLYALKLRGLRDPFLEVFNQPDPGTSCEVRTPTTVSPQALSLLNGRTSHARSLATAASLLKTTPRDEDAIRAAFRRAYARDPGTDELRDCLAYWNRATRRHRGRRPEREEAPLTLVRKVTEEDTGEVFTFTEHLDGFAGYVPDLQPGDVGARTRGLAELCLVLFNSNEFLTVP